MAFVGCVAERGGPRASTFRQGQAPRTFCGSLVHDQIIVEFPGHIFAKMLLL